MRKKVAERQREEQRQQARRAKLRRGERDLGKSASRSTPLQNRLAALSGNEGTSKDFRQDDEGSGKRIDGKEDEEKGKVRTNKEERPVEGRQKEDQQQMGKKNWRGQNEQRQEQQQSEGQGREGETTSQKIYGTSEGIQNRANMEGGKTTRRGRVREQTQEASKSKSLERRFIKGKQLQTVYSGDQKRKDEGETGDISGGQ